MRGNNFWLWPHTSGQRVTEKKTDVLEPSTTPLVLLEQSRMDRTTTLCILSQADGRVVCGFKFCSVYLAHVLLASPRAKPRQCASLLMLPRQGEEACLVLNTACLLCPLCYVEESVVGKVRVCKGVCVCMRACVTVSVSSFSCACVCVCVWVDFKRKNRDNDRL